VSPNIITFLSLIFGLIGALQYYRERIFLGAVFVFVSYFLDSIDGKIARANNTASERGALFDYFIDRFLMCIYLFSITYCVKAIIEINEWQSIL